MTSFDRRAWCRAMGHRNRVDLTGQVFGSLTALRAVDCNPRMWACRCICGKEVLVVTGRLIGGKCKSCGCTRRVAIGYPTQANHKGSRAHVSYVHRERAERALGYGLPIGAEVHHADGSKRADAPLVIVPDRAYHVELHRKMRVKAVGGNPWTDYYCYRCKQAWPSWDFYKRQSGPSAGRVTGVCKQCRSQKATAA